MENRGTVVWDVCGTLGSEQGSVLKNVGLVWIDNICNLLCQGALLSWVNDDFLSEPNERIVLRHQAIQTWRDKPAVVERVALNNVFLWASKLCLAVVQRGPRRFTSPGNPERLFFITGHLGLSGEEHRGKNKAGNPRETLHGGCFLLQRSPFVFLWGLCFFFFNTIIFSFFLKIFKTVVSKQVISQALLCFLRTYMVGKDHSAWFVFLVVSERRS